MWPNVPKPNAADLKMKLCGGVTHSVSIALLCLVLSKTGARV